MVRAAEGPTQIQYKRNDYEKNSARRSSLGRIRDPGACEGRIALCRPRGRHPVPEVAGRLRARSIFTNAGTVDFAQTNLGSYKYKKGYGRRFVGGYDFGMFRLEGELGYKHAKPKSFNPDDTFVTALNTGAGTDFTTASDFDLNDKTSVFRR